MARTGYLGGTLIRPGGTVPDQVGALIVSRIPRQMGLASHVANIRRQAIVMDAATIVARQHGFLTPGMKVGLSGARSQHFGATAGQHAAHAVKRYVFDHKDIVEVYTHQFVEEVALIGLRTMLGLVTDVDRRANLSIDKRLENNPQRIAQLQRVVDATIANAAEAYRLAQELELNRRLFERALVQSMQGGFDGDAKYAAMLTEYETALAAPPPADEAPAVMVGMIADLVA